MPTNTNNNGKGSTPNRPSDPNFINHGARAPKQPRESKPPKK